MSKKNLIFIPGLGFSSSIFHLLESRLASHKLSYIDLPLTHQCPQANINILIDHLHARLSHPAILIGWSLGGLLANQLCVRYPKHYSHCILVTHSPYFLASRSWPGMDQAQAQLFKERAQYQWPELIKQFHRLIQSPEHNPLVRLHLAQHAWKQDRQADFMFYLDLLFNQDNRATFYTMNMPLLQIFGEHDAIITSSVSEHLAAFHQTHIIKKAGHAPFLSHPELFCTHLNDFLEHPS